MTFLLQANVAIGRPDDFFAEMLKNDEHMVKVKSRLLKQQVKIKTFEEISKIAQLPEIKNVLFIGNPCYGDKSKEDNAPYVVKRIPQIEMVDGKMISPAVRTLALELE